MRVTTKSRYAIRSMYALIILGGDTMPISLKKISEYEGISLKYLEQIFSKLKQSNVVSSVRGTNGGYIVSKNLSAITLKDVIYAMDGPVKPVDCIDKDACNKAGSCAVNWLWLGLKEHVDKYLENVTMQDLKNQKFGV